MSHYEDEAQVAELKAWWNENWKALATGLVLGLGGIFGWQAWQAHEQRVAGDASQMYEELKKAAAADKIDEAKEFAAKLSAVYSDTPYAAEAALRVAELEVKAGKYDDASGHLKWVIDHSGDDGLKHVARVRQARVLWQLGKADDALKMLEVQNTGGFEALYQELRGDIKLSQGDRTAAAEAYKKALVAVGQGNGTAELQQKLDDLADVRAASAS